MKLTKFTLVWLFLCLIGGPAIAQIEGTNGFMLSPGLEVGVHGDGYEGSSTLPTSPTHYRGFTGRLGFLANPQNDGWTNYDGDFFMPGSPENRFGIEVDGVTYYNSSATGSSITSYGLTSYHQIGKCIFLDWSGSVAGIDINMTYKMDTTTYYYTVNVTLTNTNPVDKNNVYFYKSLDPDNNMDIGWGFPTVNTIVSQPSGDCSKALVSATSTNAWESYIGLASLDSNCRVARGGFYINDGSDVWDATGGLIGDVGSTAFADQAIAICHKDEALAAGESSEFQFIVCMSEAEINDALFNLYSLDYPDAPAFAGACEDTSYTTTMGGYTFTASWDDTVKTCSTEPIELSVDGPAISEFNVYWMDSLGIPFDSSITTTIVPGLEADTMSVCCVITSSGGCFPSGEVLGGFCFTLVVLQSPEIVVEEFEVLCGDSLDISTIVIVDTAEVENTITEYYSDFPDSIGDPTDLWTDPYLLEGDTMYVLVGDTTSGCYDVEFITYSQEDSVGAGGETASASLCLDDLTPIDLSGYLTSLDPDAVWSDPSASGALDETTGMLDPSLLSAGTHTYYYIIGEDPCPVDTSTITLELAVAPDAGADVEISVCSADGDYIDLDDHVAGGGTWAEVSYTRGLFDPASGVLTIPGLADGEYTFLYIVSGVAPCDDDTAEVTVTISTSPTAMFTSTPSTPETDDPTVHFTNYSLNATTYDWSFGDGATSTDEDPVHTYPAVENTYEVWLVASNDDGCKDSISVEIFIEESSGGCFYMPNSFSPGGDNLNEELKPKFCEENLDVYDYHMTIFNRWGEIIFESYNYGQGWRGEYGDKGYVDGGIYVWQIEFGVMDSDKRFKHTGHVMVLK